MAALTIGIAMNLGDTKSLHPFFSKTQDTDYRATNTPKPHQDPTLQGQERFSASDAGSEEVRNEPSKTREPRQRKSLGQQAVSAESKALLENFTKNPELNRSEEACRSASAACAISIDPRIDGYSSGRRQKRRKISLEPGDGAQVTTPVTTGSPSPRLEKQEDLGNLPSNEPNPNLDWRQQLQNAAGEPPARILVEASSPTTFVVDIPQSKHIIPATPPAEMDSASLSPETRTRRSPKTSNTEQLNDESSILKPMPAVLITTPKKMLRLNSSGKFSSPISNSAAKEGRNKAPRTRSKGKGVKAISSCIAIIRYGTITHPSSSNSSSVVLQMDRERTTKIGHEIDSIMSGTSRVMAATVQTHELNIVAAPVRPKNQPKTTHPFFMGKRNVKDENKSTVEAPKTQYSKRSTVTPGKLRSDARVDGTDAESSGSGIARTSTVKRPGSLEAPWPSRGNAHTRGSFEPDLPDSPGSGRSALIRRRLKANATHIVEDEDILRTFGQALRKIPISEVCADNGFPPPSKSIRLPRRHVTNGSVILDKVKRQLSDVLRASDSQPNASSTAVLEPHPAIFGLLDQFEDTLTSFDRGTCDTQAWTHKYAPKKASDVLQSTQSMAILRTWLTSLKVQSVGGVAKDLSEKALGKGKRQKPAKKRKKTNELDDFIVDSDSASDLDELTDPENVSDGPFKRRNGPKSLIRIGDSNSKGSVRKLKNLILISGSHGCGKTAAVYAIAKELNFDVFEINAGSKRSGKDITERVGDMTENHLVSNRQDDPLTVNLVDSDTERAAEAFQKDIASGRQGMMTSFFQKQAGGKKAQPEAKVVKESQSKSARVASQLETTIRQRKSQQQSLILLEEVDVLFEEDKGFWSTVIDLAMQSKRPMILTCNDESLLPMAELTFEAVLRFTPPSEKIVSAYLLLMAAREGHILDRRDVVSLYRAKSEDLRASITELDFWCQMAVGDRKGGLEWIYQRWPPGKDVDSEGKILRVASEGTYLSGMGWIGRDTVHESAITGMVIEEELTRQLWDNWLVDPVDTARMCSTFASPQQAPTSHSREQLETLDFLAEGRSAADVFCRVDLPATRSALADTTQPAISEKARLNYISGLPLLQADHVNDYRNIDTQLAIAMALKLQHLCDDTGPMKARASSIETKSIDIILANKQAEANLPDFSPENVLVTLNPITIPRHDQLYVGTPANSCIVDRPLSLVVVDVAPYVRSIAAADLKLEAARLRLSNLLSEGGRATKRARTTRASRSALEGGARETTRRERWFHKDLNLTAVLKTAGESWAGMSTEVKDDGSDMMTTLSGSQIKSQSASSQEA
ncbi:hypothetical protein EJ05DRAFT_506343 [Pseudovirgaria hyperparasitica]|uniref:AAA+ ATPase domain-containing protein n=1 Tax=Pseudovirgaria hyperparasitica TaxID=470096 RepID=A0A6A6WKD6_9PEZI|nr:uncharacterized protein EJ05DRAFT_506343 [Pseudovirgaria hyperparasitica]KAF2762641.1 hypothetical protein EJ05DRAFT_506343 [Pseudovirgaria hyperparasitica]